MRLLLSRPWIPPVAALAATPAASSAGSRQQPAPIVVEKAPPPAQPAPLRNGTYTFYPRLREMQGGVDKNGYIDRIVIRSGYFTIYMVNTAQAKGSRPEGGWYEGWVPLTNIILQDLDRPSRTWTPTTSGADDITGGCYFTFQGVTATRFSLTNKDKPPMIFEEIIIGEPDA